MGSGARLFQLGVFVEAMLPRQARWVESAARVAVEKWIG